MSAPPAAADVEQALARFQPQLAADHVELVPLRPGDVVVPVGLKIGAGIDHLRVQKEPVEVVRHVVVIGDVALVGLGPAVAGIGLVFDPRQGARHAGRRAQKAIGGLKRLELAQAPELPHDLAARALVGEVEQGAVLQVEQPGHIGVECRVQVRAAHQGCDHALAPDREAHGVGRQVRRDRRAVPQLEAEPEVERAVRVAQKIPKKLQPCRPAHAVLPFGERLSGAFPGHNRSEVARQPLYLPILVADGLKAAAALEFLLLGDLGRAGVDLEAALGRLLERSLGGR
jgi:hypothetical protein